MNYLVLGVSVAIVVVLAIIAGYVKGLEMALTVLLIGVVASLILSYNVQLMDLCAKGDAAACEALRPKPRPVYTYRPPPPTIIQYGYQPGYQQPGYQQTGFSY